MNETSVKLRALEAQWDTIFEFEGWIIRQDKTKRLCVQHLNCGCECACWLENDKNLCYHCRSCDKDAPNEITAMMKLLEWER